MIHVIATDLVNVDKVKVPFRREKTKRDTQHAPDRPSVAAP